MSDPDRCPYCSFDPTSESDYCNEHRGGEPKAVILLRAVVKHARPSFPKTPFRKALDEAEKFLEEVDRGKTEQDRQE